jgi:hypothetical protein
MCHNISSLIENFLNIYFATQLFFICDYHKSHVLNESHKVSNTLNTDAQYTLKPSEPDRKRYNVLQNIWLITI